MAIDLTKTKKNIIFMEQILNTIIIIIPIIIFIILWGLNITPKISKIKNLKTKASSMLKLNEKQIQELNRKNTEITNLKINLENKIKIIEESLLKEKNISTLLDTLTSTVKKHKLNFTYIKPLPIKEIEIKYKEKKEYKIKFKEIPIALEFDSNFLNFLAFLWDIEHNEPSIKLSELTLVSNPKNYSLNNKSTFSFYQMVKKDDNK